MSLLNYSDHAEKKNKKEYFIHLIKVSLADGKITKKESETLLKLGKKLGFTDPEIDLLFAKTAKSNYIPAYELAKRFEQLYDVIKMVLADGKIEDSEMHLANSFAIAAGFKSQEIPQLLDILIKGIEAGIDEESMLKAYKKMKK
jgi:uncharacterized tellurite resistance protein B-like protein